MDLQIKEKTIALIDSLKSTCQTYGMGNDGNEYKIITQVFLYKYLNDKFGYEIKKLDERIAKAEKWEIAYSELSEDEREDLFDTMNPDIPRLNPEHLISHLWNQQAKGDFDLIFDQTMIDIADKNIDIFSTQTTQNTKIPLFERLTQYVTDEAQRAPFARALVDKLVNFSFEETFSEHYDFFAAIFEYLIKDYNTAGGGKYAEYYTPHAIATIMARLLVGDDADLHNIECYDPSAGTGTLLMALGHQIGEDRCTIFAQDISQRSNKMLKLNLILNGLVSSLDHAIQGDTLVAPYHKSDDGKHLRQFDYVVSNPPFNMDFSETHKTIAAMPARFWAGVPNIPKKKKDGMAIYTCFLQHFLNSLKDDGKGAIVVPSGFLTDTGAIQVAIREKMISNRWLKAVIQMPTNVFANTNTSVSILFVDKSVNNNSVMLFDASKIGTSVKSGDNTRTVFSNDDVKLIVDTIRLNKCSPELSTYVLCTVIEANEYHIKPGLYFDMQYSELRKYTVNIERENRRLSQRKNGLIWEMRNSFAKNLIVDWFVDFNLEGLSTDTVETEYGDFPSDIKLIPLGDLVLESLGGEWGKESSEKNYSQTIRCIRGTDIPNINLFNYDDVPVRYVTKKHIKEKSVQEGDVIIEISGGSPIQSTGRVCYITKSILMDLEMPVLCTNFCRIVRLRNTLYSEYVYHYISLLYDRGYFFNLENNTTGIKNLIFNSFLKSVKIPIPVDDNIIQGFYQKLDQLCSELEI